MQVKQQISFFAFILNMLMFYTEQVESQPVRLLPVRNCRFFWILARVISDLTRRSFVSTLFRFSVSLSSRILVSKRENAE